MKSLKHLNKYLYKYRVRLVLGIICVVLSNLFAVFPARSVGKAIDMVKENLAVYRLYDGSDLQAEVYKTVGLTLLYFAAVVIVFALVKGLFMYFMRQTLIVMSRHVEHDLKNEVFAHYQELPMSFYRKSRTGDLMARISEDVSRVRMYIGPAVMYFTNLIATFAVVIPYMFSVNAMFAVYVLLPLPILSYAIFRVNNVIDEKGDAIQQQLSGLTSIAQETFSGIRVIKAFGAEKFSREQFASEVDEYRKRSLELAKVDAMFFPLMFFLTGLSTIITVGVGGFLVIRGEITVGNIAEFVIYVNLLTWPVTALGYTSSLVQRAATSQNRINEFLQIRPEITTGSLPYHGFTDAIVFDHVSFRYEGKTAYALKDISFTIRKGETLAVLGTTGSGKSTIIQLLLRMMDTEEGKITVDGNSLDQIDLVPYKQQIGYVPQDVFLFSDTVANNISFGLTAEVKDKEERTRLAAQHAALLPTVEALPDGFETLIGERGVTLSGGQKQRLSIARALVKDPEILLLDDCLSAVDTATEAEILSNLRRIRRHKTAVIVSHRVSAVKDANMILVLHDGQVVQRGTHRELINMPGRYADMYHKQVSENVAS